MKEGKGRRRVTVSDFIQGELRSRNLAAVDPVTATRWLLEAKLQKAMGSRPGSQLRRLCRKGLIAGAEKIGLLWKIKRVSRTRK